jgi:hypothetical protein
MRQIGTLPYQAQAERFTAYLITRGISAMAEEDGEAWLIWVRDEDQLEAAQEGSAGVYVSNPDDQRYRGVVREAAERLHQEARQREQARRNYVAMSERWRRGQAGNIPLVKTVIGLCVVIFLLLTSGDGCRPLTAPWHFAIRSNAGLEPGQRCGSGHRHSPRRNLEVGDTGFHARRSAAPGLQHDLVLPVRQPDRAPSGSTAAGVC